MKLLGDKVLIKADKPANETKSGILVVEQWKSLPPTGVVEAVGPAVMVVKKGDRVIFERYGSVILNEEDMRICKEVHILAILDGKENE